MRRNRWFENGKQMVVSKTFSLSWFHLSTLAVPESRWGRLGKAHPLERASGGQSDYVLTSL